MKHIKFVPNKTIVKLDDGEYWYLIAYNTNTFNMATLISMKDYDIEFLIGNFKPIFMVDKEKNRRGLQN